MCRDPFSFWWRMAIMNITGTMENPVISTNSKAQNDLNAYNEKLKPITEKMTELCERTQEGTRS